MNYALFHCPFHVDICKKWQLIWNVCVKPCVPFRIFKHLHNNHPFVSFTYIDFRIVGATHVCSIRPTQRQKKNKQIAELPLGGGRVFTDRETKRLQMDCVQFKTYSLHFSTCTNFETKFLNDSFFELIA